MSTRDGFFLSLRTVGAEVSTSTPNGVSAPVDATLISSWPSGDDEGEAGIVYDQRLTITDTPTVLDLSALPSLLGGAARDCGRLHALIVSNEGATAVTVGGGTTPALSANVIPPGGLLTIRFAKGGSDGIDVSTDKLVSISTASGTSTVRVIIAGREVSA